MASSAEIEATSPTIASDLRDIASALDGLHEDESFKALVARLRYNATRLDGHAETLISADPDTLERTALDIGNPESDELRLVAGDRHGPRFCDPVEGEAKCPNVGECPYLGNAVRDDYQNLAGEQ